MKRTPQELIEAANKLSGDPESIENFYKKWTQRYNHDVAESAYTAEDLIVDALVGLPQSSSVSVKTDDPELRIMDVGCGTGLVGAALYAYGYRNIDGCDLSAEMVAEARKSSAYQRLFEGLDINATLNPEWAKYYDCVVCAGVFTFGHVGPSALNQLIGVTRAGGVIVLTTRTTYYDATGFQALSDALQQSGSLKLLHVMRDAPYTNEGRAHYWSYVVLK